MVDSTDVSPIIAALVARHVDAPILAGPSSLGGATSCGTLGHIDDDEAVTVDLSTDEQGGARPSCLVFGTAFAGPHAVDASIAGSS